MIVGYILRQTQSVLSLYDEDDIKIWVQLRVGPEM